MKLTFEELLEELKTYDIKWQAEAIRILAENLREALR